MTPSKCAAYGMYPLEVAVKDVVHALNVAGFPAEDICLMLAPTHPISTVVRDAKILSAGADETTRVTGLINWLSQLGAVVIPSVGFFIRSQAFLHAWLAAQEAPALCGSSGTLACLGIPEAQAQYFEYRLQNDGVLIYVSCAENNESEWVMEMLRTTGAEHTASLAAEVA